MEALHENIQKKVGSVVKTKAKEKPAVLSTIDYGPKLTEKGIVVKREPSYYFFKRWLWLIFPNACLESSPDCNFSEFMYACFSDNQKTLLEKDNLYYEA